MNRFAIVAAMKRASFLLALTLLGALPLSAQSTEFGVIVGGSRRFVDNGQREGGVEWIDSDFSFNNSAVDLYWGMKYGDDTIFKLRAGRIETAVAEAYEIEGVDGTFRRDSEGEIQHIGGEVEYRFDEPYGYTGVFGGIALYRHSGENSDATNSFGWNAGVNSIFPINRRYGVIVEAAYHWSRGDFRPRHLTVGAGLRVAF